MKIHCDIFDNGSLSDVIFLNRLNATIDFLPAKIKNALLSNEIDFTERVKDNRNYYTHYSPKATYKIASLGELFMLSEKLKIILMVCILKKISFSDQQIEKIVFSKGVYIFNHLIKPSATIST